MWVRLDDGFADHPRVIGLSDRAFRVHVAAMCYAARHLTDGWVPSGHPSHARAIAELVTAGLWMPGADGGFVIRDWSQWNPSGQTIKDRRTKDAERKRRERRSRPESDGTQGD